SLSLFSLLFSSSHRVLPSFPTRRSSDLVARGIFLREFLMVARHVGRAVRLGPDNFIILVERFFHGQFQRLHGRHVFVEAFRAARSEEHTSELQSPYDLVCRLLLEKKKQK